MLKLGNKSISNLFIGQKAATKAFLGQKLVWQKATGLPYDAEVEYIHIPSGGWFDTGWKDFQTNSVTMTANIRVTQFNSAYDTYFGNYGTNPNYAFLLRRKNLTSQFTAYFSNGDFLDFNYSLGNFSEFSFNHGDFYIDGVAQTTGRSGFTMDQSVYVGAAFADGNLVFSSSEFDIKSLVCIDALGNTVHDFIPVRKGGVGYMYDRISKQLFGNQGSGNFIVGPDVVEVEYLRNTGLTQYIDTGIIGGAGLRVQTTIKPLELVNDKWAIGSLDTNARIYVAYQYRQNSGGGYWGGGYGNYFSGTDNTSFQNNQRQTLDVQFTDTEQILSIDGVERQRWNKDTFTGTVTRNLWMFGRQGNNPSVTNAFHCEIGETKIWQNGVLVRDFVPVRVGMEGAMKDKVTGKIYRNQGTGAFKFGADKKETPLMCNSYVKDGLVAMWDGIENAGWGTHDANSPINLIDGVRLQTHGTTSVSDNAFNTEASSWYIADVSGFKDAINNKNFTFESVLSNDLIANNGIFSIANRGLWIYGSGTYNVSTVNAMTTSYNPSINPTYQTDGTYGINVTGNSSSLKAIVGGNEYSGSYGTLASISTATCYIGGLNSSTTFSSGKKSFRCIRLYSRALTAEEIAWNYEIDKRRFNLA